MKKGFTLIEILIAAGLSAIIAAAGFYLLSNYTKVSELTNKSAARQQISGMVLDKLTEDTQNSQGISPSSTATRLILLYPKEALAWEYKEGKIKRKNQYLTDAGDVNSLSFKYNGKLVEIKLDKYTTKALCRN